MASVDSIQSTSNSYARELATKGQSFLDNLSYYVEANFPRIDTATPAALFLSDSFANSALDQLKARRPAAVTYGDISGTQPVAPTLLSPDVIALLNIPDVALTSPAINTYSAPAALTTTFTKSAPEFKEPATPTRPTITLPTAPTFSQIAVPEIPQVEFPTFTSTEPVDNITAPTNTFSWSEADYSSEMLDALKEKLTYDLENGGYGIEIDDERRLWERAREREIANAASAMAELERLVEGKGMLVPPGAYFAMVASAQQELINKTASASREVAINKADLFMKNRQFTMEQASQLEATLMNFHGAHAERALNAAKASCELGIAIFNAHVQRHNLRLEAYRVAAQVYETRIRAALGKIEVYKAQVEAATLDAQRQKLYADVYQSQINGVNALINVYKTDMEAARIKADIEQTKMQGFKTEIEAFLAQVQAKDAEFRGYAAQLQGETQKVALYESQVRAYTTRVAAAKARSDIEIDRAKLKIANNEILLEKYKADMQRYSTDITASSERVRAQVAGYQADITAYSAEADAIAKGLDLTRLIQQTNANVYNEFVKQKLQDAQFRFEEALKTFEFRARVSEIGAKTYMALGGAVATQIAAISSKTEL